MLTRDFTDMIVTRETGKKLSEDIKKLNGIINISEYVSDPNNAQVGIVNAVTDAYNKGYALFWGNDGKTFVSTDSILNFHLIKHIGNAKILRGTDTFYITPTSTNTNRIYVGISGSSNTFDGLSPSQPVAKLQQAFDWIENYGPILKGNWEINMTGGTFVKASLQDGLLMENLLVIKGVSVGGHPNVPTTIISNGPGFSGSGIYASNGSRLLVQDIKLTGYNGNSSSNGIAVSYNTHLETSNVHADSCYYGISGTSQSYIKVPDGIFSSCGFAVGTTQVDGVGSAIRSLQQNNHYIGDQNASDVNHGCIIQNCSRGFFAQEYSTGHVNWITIQDCETGVQLSVGSRANADGVLLKRNTRGVREDGSSHFGQTSNTVFATGVDANKTAFVRLSGSQVLGDFHVSGYEMSYSLTENTYEMKKVNTTYTQTTAQIYHTSVLKAPFWMTERSTMVMGKKIKFKVYGTLTGATTNKRINVRLTDGINQGLIGALFANTDNGVFSAEGEIYFYDKNQQYIHIASSRNGGATVRQNTAFTTCDTTKDITLTLETLVDATGDSVTIDFVELSVTG